MLKRFAKHLSFPNASKEEVESILSGDMDQDGLALFDVYDALSEVAYPLEVVIAFLDVEKIDIFELYTKLCETIDNIDEQLLKA